MSICVDCKHAVIPDDCAICSDCAEKAEGDGK